ncbi:hypothetical protein C8R47DRAFT_1223893 [Mycena vitilis]|nr:hypothetical protein C8R47DRAFT_1223893 [Mycena vitilis]
MPMLQFCAGSNDRCYGCNKPGDPTEDWKAHKLTCKDHKTNINHDADPSAEERLKLFLKWLDQWRDAVSAWAVFAADLANQPPDYLMHNCYFAEIEKRPPLEAAQHSVRSKFQLVRAGMRTDDQMRNEFERMPPTYSRQVTDDFERVRRHPRALRVTILCGTFYSNPAVGELIESIFPEEVSKITDSLSAESRLVSTALAQAWRNKFANHIRNGNVTGHKQVLENLIQGGRVLSEAALGVD